MDRKSTVPVTIRQATEADVPAVKQIFIDGMRDIIPALQREAIKVESRQLFLASGIAAVGATALQTSSWVRIGAMAALAVAAAARLAYLARKGLLGYIQYSLKDDLADLVHNYSDAGYGPGSRYWVAEAPADQLYGTDGASGSSGSSSGGAKRVIVGTLSLHRHSADTAQLRRMSVVKEARGLGIAEALARELIRYAKASGFKSVWLETTSAQRPALRLYGKLGWKTVWVKREGEVLMLHRLELDLTKLD